MHDLKRFAPIASVAALLLAAPAWSADTGSTVVAQAGTGAALDVKSLRELDDDSPLRGPGGLSVEQMEDMAVFDAAGKKIGEVEEVLATADDRIVAVTVEFGDFMGIGGKEVVVGLDQLQLDGDRFVTTLSSEQLETMPTWDD